MTLRSGGKGSSCKSLVGRKKFSSYLVGKEFIEETDHKPPIPLLGQIGLDELHSSIQHFRMRLLHFQYAIIHVSCKDFHTADALS